ncbi:Autolysin [Tetrabaena socialis]|uniref:Autolysin n=1 Tax=Tetrabaena socialis TaxID=47790 RepID=A0A2J8ADH5_9CHLO|nr:Autolysin [Tetrabaena socialis]|eukprot:PNH10563.1 Autolysin [Tetrabaena socialis]
MMHTHGLQHAGRMNGNTLDEYGEYGDPSDVMGAFAGAGNGLLCPNAPNRYLLGWASTIAENDGDREGSFGNLAAANFTRDSWIMGLTIPAASQSSQSMVVVNIGAANTAVGAARTLYPRYYISYRVRNTTMGAFDSGLPAEQSRRVFIHAYNGTQDLRAPQNFHAKSVLLASGQASFTWTSPFWNASVLLGGGLVVRVERVNDTEAIVALCRQTMLKEAGEACGDGVDNDCDGKPDSEDPDCL